MLVYDDMWYGGDYGVGVDDKTSVISKVNLQRIVLQNLR